MTRWAVHRPVAAGLRALRSWRHRHPGDTVALDLSPMVARPSMLVGGHVRRDDGWPRGVQEDDGVRWRWDPPLPSTSTNASRT